MSATNWAPDLALAMSMADEADAIGLARFRHLELSIETKPDMTPVSDADRSIETRLRELLGQQRPDDGILGEEFGDQPGIDGGRRWVIDPIDGTKSYVRGGAVWATLIALETTVDGDTQSMVGVASAPALGKRWWATREGGAWTTDSPGSAPRKIQVSSVGSLGDASMSYSSLTGWRELGKREAFIELTDAMWRTRAYGDFWSHLLVAEGVVDIAVEPELSRWDMAALQPIIEEAGGRFTNLSGVRGSGGRGLVTSNGLLHDNVLSYLS